MKLSTHFTLAEFTASDTAERLGIDNSLPDELLGNAYEAANMMEHIREHLCNVAQREIPIIITSGHRCEALEKVITHKAYLNRCARFGLPVNDETWGIYFRKKDHPKANSMDFRAPAFGTPLAICQAIAPFVSTLGIGQLIYEFSWVHASTRLPDKAINRIITVSGNGYVAGIHA